MTTSLKTIAIAAVLGFASLAAVAPAASASDFGGAAVETVGYRSGFFEIRDGYGWRQHDNRGYGWGRPGRPGRCSPGLAVAKARDLGLRRARIADITPRRVIVEGFRYRGYDQMVFANDRGCPTLRR